MAEEPLVIVAVRLVLEFVWTLIVMNYETLKAIYLFFIPPEPKDVTEDIIFITGAGHGMGREVALRFGRLGATVVCVDVNPASNEETAKMIKAEKGKAFHYQCDITNRDAVFKLAEKVQKEVGDVTILLNNAGIMPCKPLLRHSEKEIRSMYDVNVHGVLWTIQAFLPTMLENNKGHLVVMSSMAGLMGLRNIVPYCGTKFAVRGIMEALAMELHEDKTRASDGIKFTTIYPTMVNTGLCHNPRARFAKLNMVEKEFAADLIVDAIRRELTEISVPTDLYYANRFIFRLLPYKAGLAMNDFVATGLDPHD
ncbi:epidermal retinol dehydrogenase 2-like isoform X2 [Ostrinia furnacalis]|uniref:epidermal retinol dehydrogenase 2-like isoform X1 n=2 Tax=Ostrinia furnacalis TaxID=93504 RepID=UPI00103E67E3|nr:epidermal retinol dehydrogenase 2-like isoform X1 [Ostrinia furnacalis]XP_028169999.1 epidermal retinol dehydrogenase 2-like isoform X2 [Ostrinia furnacalis]